MFSLPHVPSKLATLIFASSWCINRHQRSSCAVSNIIDHILKKQSKFVSFVQFFIVACSIHIRYSSTISRSSKLRGKDIWRLVRGSLKINSEWETQHDTMYFPRHTFQILEVKKTSTHLLRRDIQTSYTYNIRRVNMQRYTHFNKDHFQTPTFSLIAPIQTSATSPSTENRCIILSPPGFSRRRKCYLAHYLAITLSVEVINRVFLFFLLSQMPCSSQPMSSFHYITPIYSHLLT